MPIEERILKFFDSHSFSRCRYIDFIYITKNIHLQSSIRHIINIEQLALNQSFPQDERLPPMA